MTGSQIRPTDEWTARGRMWWLPRQGIGNGLDDTAWAVIAEIDARIAARLLDALREAGVPAFVSPVPTMAQRLRAHMQGDWNCRVWVGTNSYATGERVIMRIIAGMRTHGR